MSAKTNKTNAPISTILLIATLLVLASACGSDKAQKESGKAGSSEKAQEKNAQAGSAQGGDKLN